MIRVPMLLVTSTGVSSVAAPVSLPGDTMVCYTDAPSGGETNTSVPLTTRRLDEVRALLHPHTCAQVAKPGAQTKKANTKEAKSRTQVKKTAQSAKPNAQTKNDNNGGSLEIADGLNRRGTKRRSRSATERTNSIEIYQLRDWHAKRLRSTQISTLR